MEIIGFGTENVFYVNQLLQRPEAWERGVPFTQQKFLYLGEHDPGRWGGSRETESEGVGNGVGALPKEPKPSCEERS